MMIYIGLRGIGRDQSHIVEGRHQDAAIEGEEMHVTVELVVDGGKRFAAGRYDGSLTFYDVGQSTKVAAR